MAARKLVRLHPALRNGRKVLHVFSEIGYEMTVPASYRHPQLKKGKVLEDEEIVAIQEAAREWERNTTQRRVTRAMARDVDRPRAGEISALEAGAHERLFVALDGHYAFTVTRSLALDAGLRLGMDLDAEQVSALRLAYSTARVAGMIDNLIAYRPRTVIEVRRRLAEKGIEPEVAEAAIAQRLGVGYGVLSDEQFIDWFAEHRGLARGKDFGALVGELRRLGVADEAIDAARSTYPRDEALELALAKAVRGLDLSEETGRRRFVGRLLRRGFHYGDARDYLDAQGQDGEGIED